MCRARPGRRGVHKSPRPRVPARLVATMWSLPQFEDYLLKYIYVCEYAFFLHCRSASFNLVRNTNDLHTEYTSLTMLIIFVWNTCERNTRRIFAEYLCVEYSPVEYTPFLVWNMLVRNTLYFSCGICLVRNMFVRSIFCTLTKTFLAHIFD